jgi:hypothetical protein
MRPSFSVITLWALLLPFAAPVSAQTQPGPTPQTPDLLGIYPGMPERAARAQLQRHSTTARVTSELDMSFFMMVPERNRDMVRVYLTQAPNESAVWLIQRSQNFDPQNTMTVKALLAGLHEKYGKATLTMDRGGGGLYLFWIFDPSGKLLAASDQDLTGCSSSNFINYIRTGPPPTLNSIEQACFRSFFAVTAMLNQRDAETLQAYTVELVNLPYMFKAATNTLNANNAAADKARRAQLKKADQNKPSF